MTSRELLFTSASQMFSASSPESGWEKGQVENQVGNVREWLFTPTPRFKDFAELNAWLALRCEELSQRKHPEQSERSVSDCFAEEKALLIPVKAVFDGYVEKTMRVSCTCLIKVDHNRYSVPAEWSNHVVSVRITADRLRIVAQNRVVAEHARCYGRGQLICAPWHYLPVLARKPGALRNGAPFKNWELPPALARVRRRLVGSDDADRQFVAILAAVMDDGLEAVEAACTKALNDGPCGQDVVLNILARQREEDQPPPLDVPSALILSIEPAADCARYDRLLPGLATAEVSTDAVLEEAADGTT